MSKAILAVVLLTVAAAVEAGAAAPVQISPAHWIVVLITVVTVVVCVTLHYEIFSLLSSVLVHLHTRPRVRILALILSLILLHIVEIWIFAGAYYLISDRPGFGGLEGMSEHGFLEYVYYSAVVYTTLGFGDLIPHGPVRFLTGTEGLTGFLLVTWSASFTFLEMQKFWDKPK